MPLATFCHFRPVRAIKRIGSALFSSDPSRVCQMFVTEYAV